MEDYSSSNSRRAVSCPWGDLPKDLVHRISKSLHTETDVRRFRAVCSSWRSSTPPRQTPQLKLPFPTPNPKHQSAYFTLTHRTVYLLQSPEIKQPHGWIVKIEKLQSGKVRVLSPVNDRIIKILPETTHQLPEVLNTLDFRLFEVCKACHLSYVNPSENSDHDCDNNEVHKYFKKVVFSSGVCGDEYVVMAIDENDELWYIKSGDKKWTQAYFSYRWHEDVVVDQKGIFYSINVAGGAWVFDSSSYKLVRITDNIGHYASQRQLLELFDGEMWLVEVVTDNDKRLTKCKCDDPEIGCQCGFPGTVKHTAEDVVICKVDEKKEAWVEVKNLDNRIIFVGEDCSFFVPAEELTGCKATRVFYADRFINFQTEEPNKPELCIDYAEDEECLHYWSNGKQYTTYNYWSESSSDDDDYPRKDTFVPSKDIRVKFRGLHGHNIGFWDCHTRNIGSLLKFPEYADIFWPPPSWLRRN